MAGQDAAKLLQGLITNDTHAFEAPTKKRNLAAVFLTPRGEAGKERGGCYDGGGRDDLS